MRDPEGIEAKKIVQTGMADGKDVLEIGCGNGWLTWQFAAGVKKVIGIDTDIENLRQALSDRPRELTDVHFAQGEGEGLPFASSAFDIVVFTNSL
jgi:ubiquinone/menaquinone biosynthesis C-methylase UbiE